MPDPIAKTITESLKVDSNNNQKMTYKPFEKPKARGPHILGNAFDPSTENSPFTGGRYMAARA